MTNPEQKIRTSEDVEKEMHKLTWEIDFIEEDKDKILNTQLFPIMVKIKDMKDKWNKLVDEKIELEKKEGKWKNYVI